MIDYREDNRWSVYVHIVPKEISGYEWNKYYVGITSTSVDKRWRNGKGYKNQVFEQAITKYSWNNIEHEVVASNLTKIEAGELEKILIKKLNSTSNKYGYNVETGGFNGCLYDYPNYFNDLTGKVFGKIHIVGCAGYKESRTGGRRHILWNCYCECNPSKNLQYIGESFTEKNKLDCGCERSNKCKENSDIKYFKDMIVADRDECVELYICTKNNNYNILFDKEDGEFFMEHRIYFRKNGLMYDNNGEKEYLYKFFGFEKMPSFLNGNTYDYRKHNLKTKEKEKRKVSSKVLEVIKKNTVLKYKPIIQYDLNHVFIKRYNCISEAELETGCKKTNISACCKKRQNTCGGFIWEYENDIDISVTETDILYVYNLDGEYLRNFQNLLEASNFTNIEQNIIYKALHKDSHFGGRFLWSLTYFDKLPKYVTRKGMYSEKNREQTINIMKENGLFNL